MKTSILLILTLTFTAFLPQADFLTEQKRYKNVRTAVDEKTAIVTSTLIENGINLNELNILIIAFKAEAKFDLYAKKQTEATYKKITSYDICSGSGLLGPKRKLGDSQVPEGFYHIDRFNPASSYNLSLGINYPNLSDKRKSTFSSLGGNIFIHGACVTIGCVPMTDDKIKEIYLYAIHARNNGQLKIPVYVFPFKMTDQNFNSYKNQPNNSSLIDFWSNLKTGYDKFMGDKKELKISVDSYGNYTL
jgi:murein L,D-transpeptidase YafK